jgi:hypothetical protein
MNFIKYWKGGVKLCSAKALYVFSIKGFLFTKIVAGAQDLRLAARFYSLMPNSAAFVLGDSAVPSSFD